MDLAKSEGCRDWHTRCSFFQQSVRYLADRAACVALPSMDFISERDCGVREASKTLRVLAESACLLVLAPWVKMDSTVSSS